ncbi:MAG: AAA family ATPase [Victivallales bacterium]|nr:AAA family ATPase [Victivallales bacterium]
MTKVSNLNETMTTTGDPNPSEEQLRICKEVVKGGNHAIFGETGIGKTRLIRLIVEELKGMGKKVLCVAPNWTATLNMGIKEALPIHLVFHLPEESKIRALRPDLFGDSIEYVERIVPSWEKGDLFMPVIPDTLIIDEISMCRSDIFAVIDRIMRIVKKTDMPFGGIQLIVVGNPMKIVALMSVENDCYYIKSKYGSHYCFDTQTWNETYFKIHKLTTVYRQSQDPQLNKYLHAMHSLSITDRELAELNNMIVSKSIPEFSYSYFCRLLWLKVRAIVTNTCIKSQLIKTSQLFESTIIGDFPLYDFPVNYRLNLDIGERVLLTANYHDGAKTVYERGDLGTFVNKSNEKPMVLLDRNNELVEVSAKTWEHYDYLVTDDNQSHCKCTGWFTQYPILPGYAIAVEQAQGMILSGRLQLDLPLCPVIPFGLIYTALSCVQFLECISCNRVIKRRDLQPPKDICDFMTKHDLL